MRGNQRLILLLFPIFRVLRNPSREFRIATTLKLLKNLFRLWGIFLPNLRILSRKNNESALFTLFRAMSVITSISDRPNVSLVKFERASKSGFLFQKRKFSFSLVTSLKLSSPIGITTDALVWKPGISTPSTTLLQIVMMAAYFLTPIYTSSEKGQLISERMKGLLVAAFRSPLMKTLDRSFETLGLWIVTSPLHSLNLKTRVASNHVKQRF